MFVRLYASGTNVQRLAKCSKNINGVIYTSYAQLEQSEPNIVRRKFFCTQVNSLKTEVEKLDVTVMPSWSKIWGRPLANESFISNLALSLTGQNPLRSELNLSSMMGESVYCFMLLVSADKKEMKQIKEIFNRTIPDYHIKVLNGDYTTNIKAEDETIREINESKIAGKKGVIIIANQMGSRSYSVSEIQSTVIAFDRGSVDATVQKVSRCLTPGDTWTGSEKQFGGIVDLSFDPNRAENIEKLILEEAILVQRAGEAEDFTKAVKFVLSSVDLFKMNEYGYAEEVTEEAMFGIFGDNDAMLRVADVSVDLVAALESGMFDILSEVTATGKSNKSKKDIVGKGVKNSVKKGATAPAQETISDSDKKKMEEIINAAIQALNMSATSVYFLANGNGESYRECLEEIAKHENTEFVEFYGVTANNVISLLDQNILNEAILDVIVQNSQPKKVDNLFV